MINGKNKHTKWGKGFIKSYAKLASQSDVRHPGQANGNNSYVSEDTGDQSASYSWYTFVTYIPPDFPPPEGSGTIAQLRINAVADASVRLRRTATCPDEGCASGTAEAEIDISFYSGNIHYVSRDLEKCLSSDRWGAGVKSSGSACTNHAGGSVNGTITVWPSVGIGGGVSWGESQGDTILEAGDTAYRKNIDICFLGSTPTSTHSTLTLTGTVRANAGIDGVTFADATATVKKNKLEIKFQGGCVKCPAEWYPDGIDSSNDP